MGSTGQKSSKDIFGDNVATAETDEIQTIGIDRAKILNGHLWRKFSESRNGRDPDLWDRPGKNLGLVQWSQGFGSTSVLVLNSTYGCGTNSYV